MRSVDVIIDHDNLNREVYYFYLENEYHLWLDTYMIQARETTRHKFKNIKIYNRLDNRDNSLNENDVILSDEIKQQALKQLISQIHVEKWSKRQ